MKQLDFHLHKPLNYFGQISESSTISHFRYGIKLRNMQLISFFLYIDSYVFLHS